MDQVPTTADPSPLPATGGHELLAAVATSATWLERHADALNALNVFPVPDGDTGLNMSLTLRSAVDEVPAAAGQSLGNVANALARGALMGARGNSGVILAQLTRGVARALDGHEVLSPALAARALAEGADAAYQAVVNPVEGTILTVARAAAAAAVKAAETNDDLVTVLEEAHRAAQQAVLETPQHLPVLLQAGVVDAGGEGYRVILEGLLAFARGETLPEKSTPTTMRADLASLHLDTHDVYGYCTEVLFRGEGVEPGAVRTRLLEIGTSVLVVGDSQLLKVHIHTMRPGTVLDLATELGEIVKVKVDNMQIQHAEFAGSRRRQRPPSRQAGTTLVAVAIGEGFRTLFTSLGAVVVVAEHTMNPSVQQIVAAVKGASRDDVIIAANDPNVVLAAQQAAALVTEQHVLVLSTRNMPQGLAAALALNPDDFPGVNSLPKLEAAAHRCQVIEIARAARDAAFDDLQVSRGDFLSMLDGQPTARGDDHAEALATSLEKLDGKTFEVATIYWGIGGNADRAEALAGLVRRITAVPETTVVYGGQPHFDYVVSLE